MQVMGIDPGVATTGYGIIKRERGGFSAVAFGTIQTPAGVPHAERLAGLRAGLDDVIVRYEPQIAAVERLFFNNNAKTAMAVGQASGVALLAAAERGVGVATYTPSEVKSAVVGVGNASKRQVQSMVAVLLRLAHPPRPPDAADACALAICHLNRAGLVRAVESALG